MEKELTALRREILLLSLLQHPQQNTINPSKGLRNACLYGINIAASQKKHNLKTWLSQERIVSWCPVCPQSHEGNLSNFSKLKVMKIKTFCWVQPQYLFCKVLCVILDYWLDSFFCGYDINVTFIWIFLIKDFLYLLTFQKKYPWTLHTALFTSTWLLMKIRLLKEFEPCRRYFVKRHPLRSGLRVYHLQAMIKVYPW